jgi:hypothetical protein
MIVNMQVGERLSLEEIRAFLEAIRESDLKVGIANSV